MLGMHGTYEANMAMHDCDVMICIGARFDDRITGRLNAFSPNSKKIHIDIDPSSINKNVRADIGILGDVGPGLGRSGASVACDRAGRQKGALPLVGADRQMARSQFAGLQAERRCDHASICGAAALCADQRNGHVHHHGSRPASDVGGPALRLRKTEPLDDQRRAGHDGLRFAGGTRRADRSSGSRWLSISPAMPRC